MKATLLERVGFEPALIKEPMLSLLPSPG